MRAGIVTVVTGDQPAPEIGVGPDYGMTYVASMFPLGAVENYRVEYLKAVANEAVVADHGIRADVGAGPDRAVVPDHHGAFDRGPGFDGRARADDDRALDANAVL